MPIYEYRCTQCGHKLETLQRFSDPPLTTCPACGKETLAKQLSAAGFQLKGSGWYQTDFRGGGSKPAEKTEGAKAEGASESKADAKSETSAATPAASAPSTPAASPAPSSTPSTGSSAS